MNKIYNTSINSCVCKSTHFTNLDNSCSPCPFNTTQINKFQCDCSLNGASPAFWSGGTCTCPVGDYSFNQFCNFSPETPTFKSGTGGFSGLVGGCFAFGIFLGVLAVLFAQKMKTKPKTVRKVVQKAEKEKKGKKKEN